MTRYKNSSVIIQFGLVVGMVFSFAGCGDNDHPHKSGADKKPAAEKNATTNRIPIPSSVRDNLGITFAKVEYRYVSATRRYPGKFESDIDAHREYRMPFTGVIEPLVKPYQPVAIGDALARISGRNWVQLQRDWIESRSSGDNKDPVIVAALQARQKLLADQIGVAAGLNSDDTKLEMLATASALTIYARAAGIVEPSMAIAGTVLNEGELLLSTLDPSRVRLRASTPQGDLGVIRPTQPAHIIPMVDGYTAKLPARMVLGLEASSTLRTQDIIAWLTPKEGDVLPVWARPGVAALLEIQVAGGDGELAIPITATIRDGLDTIIFRRDPENPNEVIRMVANLGVNDGLWVELLTGVKEGDEIVVDGIYQLKLSGAGKADLGGHFHADGSFHAEADGKDE